MAIVSAPVTAAIQLQSDCEELKLYDHDDGGLDFYSFNRTVRN